jgi:hypothetical protein
MTTKTWLPSLFSVSGGKYHYAAGAIHESAAWCPTRTLCGRTVTPLNYYETAADADHYTGGRLAMYQCRQCLAKIEGDKS